MDDLNESGVLQILVECRGDMIQASRRLAIRPGKLQRYIRTIPSLRTAWMAMESVKDLPEYGTLSTKAFEAEMEAALAPMRMDALETIYELATMEHGSNSSLADVKLKAAIQLRGPVGGLTSRGDGMEILQELNALYQSSAPRIKTMRATLTVEMGAEAPPIQYIPSASEVLAPSASDDEARKALQ